MNWVAGFAIGRSFEKHPRGQERDVTAVRELAQDREEVLLAALQRVNGDVMVEGGARARARALLSRALDQVRDRPGRG